MERLRDSDAIGWSLDEGGPAGWVENHNPRTGEKTWVCPNTHSVVVYKIHLLGDTGPAPQSLDDFRAVIETDRRISVESLLLGRVLHSSLTLHHVVEESLTLTTLWADAWPSHTLFWDDSEDGNHTPETVPDWHLDYLDHHLRLGRRGFLPTIARQLWSTAVVASPELLWGPL